MNIIWIEKKLLKAVILSRKTQKASNVRKVSQKTVYPITQKSKFCKSSFGHHLQLLQKSLLAHGLERSRKKFLFFIFHKKVWSTWQNILLCKDVLSVVSHLFLQKYFSGRKSHAFLLLASYALFLYEWNEKMGPTHNIFLNPKDLAQTSTAIGWKK